MIPSSFSYQRAGNVKEALAALSSEDVKLLAGGHSLIPTLKLRLNQPSKLVDIANIASLKNIEEVNGEIVIGAAATHYEISTHPLVQRHLPWLAKGASCIGDVQVRYKGTIGGSLAHADPSADWPALVLAADATLSIESARGSRKVMATDFFTGLFSTALEQGELITAIHIPIPAKGSKGAYVKFPQPASRYALVGCAVLCRADGKVNIAFTGVSQQPFRDEAAEQVFRGKAMDAKTIAQAVAAAVENRDILSDHYASEKYRKHLAKVFLKRAIQAAG